MSLLTLLFVALAAGPGASSAAAAGCDRFAAPTGHDNAAGTAVDPVRSPQRLVAGLGPGQTGCLRSGTYTGTGRDGFVLDIDRGGRRDAPITLRNAPGASATLHGVIAIRRGADDVRIVGLTLDARRPDAPLRGQVGVAVMAARTQLLRNRITSSQARSCVLLGSNTAAGGARDTLIRGNVFTNCGNPANQMFDHGVYAAQSVRARIVDNLFVATSGFAVQLYPNAQRSVVRGNVMYGNGGGVVFGGDGPFASSGNLVTDNVIARSRRAPELSGSFGAAVGQRNVARSNCLVPGLSAADEVPRGFRMAANHIAPDACPSTMPTPSLARLVTETPAIAALQRRLPPRLSRGVRASR